MANYYSYVRTNYFHVKDAESFRKFIANISSTEQDKVELLEEKDENGNLIFAFGCQGQPAYPEDESYEGITEALSELVADDDAIIITEIGHEKLCYLVGEARVITARGEKFVSISDLAIQTAREILNMPEWNTKNEY